MYGKWRYRMMTTAQRSICPNRQNHAFQLGWAVWRALEMRRISVFVNIVENYSSIKQHHSTKLLKITRYLPQLFPWWPS